MYILKDLVHHTLTEHKCGIKCLHYNPRLRTWPEAYIYVDGISVESCGWIMSPCSCMGAV